MLDYETRAAIWRLTERGHGLRAIARAVGVSRNAVRRVLRSGAREVPRLERTETLAPHVDLVRDLHARCEGNLVRVQEELAVRDVDTAYSTLTAFCRRHGIGVVPKQPAGRYHFEPGEEMQHDTSPHTVTIAGARTKVECASLILCYSRMIYAQVYPRWTRFECRVFLTEAVTFFEGACGRCMLDNSSVIIAHGTGPNAVPAPIMERLATRFGFRFVAHHVGDANRSGRVERPFHYIEHNFYAGRTFANLSDLNAQLRDWCDAKNRQLRRHLGARPLELYPADRARMTPLPVHVPEVYDVHSRRVDVEGYVNLHTNRYSVEAELIGRRVEVHESATRVRVFDGNQLVVDHERCQPGARMRVLADEHRGQRRRYKPSGPSHEETTLRAAAPALDQLCSQLRTRHGGRAMKAMRWLHRMYLEYPSEPLIDAVATAHSFGLCDLERIERMVLARIAGDFFQLPLALEHTDDKDTDDG